MSKISDFTDEFITRLKKAGLYGDFANELKIPQFFKPTVTKPKKRTAINKALSIDDNKLKVKLKRSNYVSRRRGNTLDNKVKKIVGDFNNNRKFDTPINKAYSIKDNELSSKLNLEMANSHENINTLHNKVNKIVDDFNSGSQFDGTILFFDIYEPNPIIPVAVRKNVEAHLCKGPGGLRYRHIKTQHTFVTGNLMGYNNMRTYKNPYIGQTKRRWKNLLKILKTDPDMKETLDRITQSGDLSLIITKNVTNVRGGGNVHRPLDDELFADIDNSMIYNKFITYDLKMQAKTFGEMFNIVYERYTLDNYKANSCFFNLIVDTYRPQFQKLKPDGKRMYSDLTYESLCDLLAIKYKDRDMGLAIRDSIPFFEKFHLGLEVINVFGHMLFAYEPENMNKNISPAILRILIHNNHPYKLDNDSHFKLRSLKKTMMELQDIDEIQQLTVSKKYKIRQVENDIKVMFINSIDECAEKLIECVNNLEMGKEHNKIKFTTTTDLTYFLFQMLNSKYVPRIGYAGGRIIQLAFKIDKYEAIIENSDVTAPDDSMIELNTEESYKAYHKADGEFYGRIIKKHLMSEYNEKTLDFEEKYPIIPLSGYTTETYRDRSYNAIDFNKAYTSCMMNINNVPVFGYFDNYMVYDAHEIEDMSVYCVEVKSNDIQTTILFQQVYSRCYGFLLKEARKHGVEFKINSFRRPSNIETVEYKKAVDILFSYKEIESHHKKYIVNKTTGLLEKKYNTSHICKVFSNREEASYYQIKYGGKIIGLSESIRVEHDNTEADPLDYGITPLPRPPGTYVSYTSGKKIYLFILEKKGRLTEGFRPIKEMIYNLMSIKLFNLYKDATSKGVAVIGIKTDALLIMKSKSEVGKFFKFDNEIGGIKFETGKCLTNKKIAQEQNQSFGQQVEIKINDIQIMNELDSKEINKIFDKNHCTLIKGLYPGVGKTTSVLNYVGHTILFITPFNKLAQALRKKGRDAITLNMLIGFFGEGQEYAKFKVFDVSAYDTICFDEVMLYAPNLLKKVDMFIKGHQEIKFMATGDLDQLQPFDLYHNNIVDIPGYIKKCINFMFENQITLKINKRLKTDKQKEKLTELKHDIFNSNIPIIEIFKKHGFNMLYKMDEVKTNNNICYFNTRAEFVNKHIHKQVVKPTKTIAIDGVQYWAGLELVCHKHFKDNRCGVRLFVNYIYKILSIGEKFFVIKDEVEDEKITLDIKLLDHFKLPYAGTCHSYQGLSIEEKTTIFDVNTPYVDRFFIWTAITRATDLDNVNIFVHSDTEVDNMARSKRKQYWEHKVENYKKQDQNAGRAFEKDKFIDADWIKEAYSKLPVKACSCCRTPYETVIEQGTGTVTSNLTVDRIDNDLAHLKTNCQLLCKTCNSTNKKYTN